MALGVRHLKGRRKHLGTLAGHGTQRLHRDPSRQAGRPADRARLLPVQGRRGAGALRRQGQEPAQPRSQLFRRVPDRRARGGAAAAPQGARRRDRGHLEREGGRRSRERADQAPSTALQRQASRRQGLPVPAPRSAGRLAAARHRAPAVGRWSALLRPLSFGHGGSPHAAAGEQALPAANLQRCRARLPLPTLPAVPDPALSRTVRLPGRPLALPRAGARRGAVSRGAPRRAVDGAAPAHGRCRRGDGLRAGRAPSRPAARRRVGARVAARGGGALRGPGRGGPPPRARSRSAAASCRTRRSWRASSATTTAR
jgi:hypothetical protein